MPGRRSSKHEFGEPVLYTPAGKLITHGGAGTAYSNYGCRCEPCTDANTLRNDRRRQERYYETNMLGLTDGEGVPGWVAHGASAYSNWGCRCVTCSAAHHEKSKEYASASAQKRTRVKGEGK